MRLILIATVTLATSAAFAQTTSDYRTPHAGGPKAKTAQATANVQSSDCNRLWEPATHMSKEKWARTCERVQARLQEIQSIEDRARRPPKE
jgi:hypothetical protein